ncbi:MAG: phage baseplate protein [Lactococcus chungangensis]|uniref:Phage baseplate protein n=1 Tax=Pseudolactococcus chungangensis TaxID=451457 RepID=A0A847J1S8_9LACT|nr:phage baseplate protein [Lactococcus chungangensis]
MTSRKFLLYNSEDDLVDLNNHEIFVLNPTGLGVSFSNSFSNVSANFLQEKSVLNSASLKLDIIFSRNSTTPYEKYEEFVKFLNKPPFKLIYEINGKTFQRECVLSELSKGEIVTNVLAESLTLDFTTPFYKEISETYKPNSDTEGDGKIYAGTNKPRNLIANPNFLNNMQDWSNVSDPEGTYQIQAPASDKPNSNILKLTSSNNKLSSFLNTWGLNVRKGERLSFRVDIKTENNQDYDRPVIIVVCGTGEKNYKYSDFGITSSSSDFETATISFIVPENGAFQLYLINQNLSTISEMSTYFREPMLIRGDASDMPVDFYSGKPSNNYYVYPYVYESDYNGKSGVFQIENNSVYIGSAKGSPVEITVHGPCTNPYWEILDGSKVLQSDGYNIDVPEGYRLVVSSVVQKQRVKLIAPDGTISDVYQQQDLSKSNFVTIPEGHVTLAFHNVGDVSFNYREEYITV